MNDKFNLFFKLTKVDEARRLVYGRATEEIIDGAKEIMDYKSSKPLFEKWSQEALKRTQAAVDTFGKEAQSLGNIRVQHTDEIGGKAIELNFRDDEKAIDIGTYCGNDRAWEMIKSGQLTGFSVGGSYERLWPDTGQYGVMRYTANPVEISYVDSPAVKTAMFTMIKADGTNQLMKATRLEDLIPNPASEDTAQNEVENEPDPELDKVPSQETVKEIPVVAAAHLSTNLIEQNGVKEVSAPVAEPIRKDDEPEWLGKFTDAINQLVELRKVTDEEKTKLEAKLKSLGSRVGISRREGESLTAPKDYPSDPNEYGDPANWSYPVDKSRYVAAIGRFNGGAGKNKYKDSEWHTLGRRIARLAGRFGAKYNYSPTNKEITRKETKMALTKADAQNLLNQLSAALGVATDQIKDDPGAIADLLMSALGSVDSASTSAGEPMAPTGSQADADVTTLKAATPTMGTPSTPSTPSTETKTATAGTMPMAAAATPTMTANDGVTVVTIPSSSSSPSSPTSELQMAVEKLTKNQEVMAESMAKMLDFLNGKSQVQKAQAPVLGDLAALVNVKQTEAKDQVLEQLMDGSRYALRKAAEILGTKDHPDVAGVIQKANQSAVDNLARSGRFTQYYGQMYPGMFQRSEPEA